MGGLRVAMRPALQTRPSKRHAYTWYTASQHLCGEPHGCTDGESASVNTVAGRAHGACAS